MSYLKTIWNYMFSPKLYKIYDGSVERIYKPSSLEKWGDQVIYSLNIMWNISLYTSPILIGFLYKKSYLAAESFISITKFAFGLGLILAVSLCMRSVGRANNADYRSFMQTYMKAINNYNRESKQQIRCYDFDFKKWPVDFNWNDASADKTKVRKYLETSRNRSASQWAYSLPCQIAAYIAVHTFGIRMIYPGAVGILNLLMEPGLLQGRAKLVKDNKGIRNKLRTIDNNDVDTMFINNRGKTSKGDILVICSEGNAGFYEIGIMCTPIEAGYSVLGWNHPGFAGSTGRPYPVQDQNAMDVVMQFAINSLNFTPENIILFGWSIGGYSSSWAAMNYPDVKGVVLDATFDDILPLALPRIPAAWEGIVKLAIRDYINLNIAEQMYQYPGPVLMIRRTEDEIICTEEGVLASNRGNHLLVKLLKYRFPVIFGINQLETVNEYLSLYFAGQSKMLHRAQIDEDICASLLASYISENSKSYPMLIGDGFTEKQKSDMALFLVKKHMKDYQSSHCLPLPQEYMQTPWDVQVESDYVFT
ncbi:protein ABHD16A [Ctenocephalides felis]|uniref:protein ABHD16A n=1 Tax=Ctenocephalides felis TaxID=7515 RepID=UPI000E6E44B6|nr:protein ABHD16A [Ctenocephalides felis]